MRDTELPKICTQAAKLGMQLQTPRRYIEEFCRNYCRCYLNDNNFRLPALPEAIEKAIFCGELYQDKETWQEFIERELRRHLSEVYGLYGKD